MKWDSEVQPVLHAIYASLGSGNTGMTGGERAG